MPKTATAPKSKAAVRPLGDKILVRRDEAQSKTDSGIYLPETGKERPKTGTVEAVGTGALNTDTGQRIPLTVKKGDRVLFTSYAPEAIEIGDEEYLLMSESDILAIIE